MNCPKCGAAGQITKWKKDGYRRYAGDCGHPWTIGAKKRGLKPGQAPECVKK